MLRIATSPIEGRPWHIGKLHLFARGSPFGATATTAASGGNREELLGQLQATAQQTLGAATRPWRGAPERARTLPVKRRRSDSIALTKGLLIAAQRLSGDGLALSVCFAATSPKGRGFRSR